MRKKVIVGNWKMNHTRANALAFVEGMKEEVKVAKSHNILIGIAPTFMSLDVVSKKKPAGLILSAQNVNENASGAYTGEVAINMLQEVKGLTHIIIGHSERRTYDNETNEKCNKKIVKLIHNDMVPVYCCGETLTQFENGETKKVVEEQIRVGLANLCEKCISKVVVAYEPVWSIGTGKNASKEIAEDICKFIRDILRDMYGDACDQVLILYGGSVKPDNIQAYLSQENVDGALVGGASLKVDSYEAMLHNLVK